VRVEPHPRPPSPQAKPNPQTPTPQVERG
jgi:hypothetical protein